MGEKEYILGKDDFFSKYKHLKGLIFYRVENEKVRVKIALPKHKKYILKTLNS